MREGDTLTLYCHTEGIPKPKVSWFFRKRTSSGSSGHHHSNTAANDRSSIASVNHQQQHQQTHHSKNGLFVHEQVLQEGDTLVIKNVTRFYSGVFECIANNSVPPAASRKIKLSVECNTQFCFAYYSNITLIDVKLFSSTRTSCTSRTSRADVGTRR